MVPTVLGGNSLLEITTFGKLAGENAFKHAVYASNKPSDDSQKEKDTQYIQNIYAQENSINFYPQRESLGELFYKDVGIVRQ